LFAVEKYQREFIDADNSNYPVLTGIMLVIWELGFELKMDTNRNGIFNCTTGYRFNLVNNKKGR
jgi:hypothetical protein